MFTMPITVLPIKKKKDKKIRGAHFKIHLSFLDGGWGGAGPPTCNHVLNYNL